MPVHSSFDIAGFLKSTLALVAQHLAPEEQHRAEWWQAHLQALAKQEPKLAAPVKKAKRPVL